MADGPSSAGAAGSDLSDVATDASTGIDQGAAEQTTTTQPEPGESETVHEHVLKQFEDQPDEDMVTLDDASGRGVPAPPREEGKKPEREPTTEDEDEEEPPAGDSDDWLSREEMAQLSPRARQRIERLWGESKQYREYATQIEPWMEPIRQFRLTQEDVQIGAGVIAALNSGQFEVFLEAVEPYRKLAREVLGLDLPDDLQGMVDEGEMTEAAARMMAKTRGQAALMQVRGQQQQQHIQRTSQEQQQQAQVTLHAQMRDAVNQWEDDLKGRDPDFSRLRGLIWKEIRLMVADHGMPSSVQGALQMAEKARQSVMEQAKAIFPKAPRPIRPPLNGSGRSQPARSEPRDVYGHVFQKLGID